MEAGAPVDGEEREVLARPKFAFRAQPCAFVALGRSFRLAPPQVNSSSFYDYLVAQLPTPMATLRISEWQKLPLSLSELCLSTTLRCGQSFRWRKSDDDIWTCGLHGRILCLRQDAEYLHYRAIFPPSSTIKPPTPPPSTPSSASNTKEIDKTSTEDDYTLSLVKHYLNLTPNLHGLYTQWSSADANFARKAPLFTGVRILQQDAWEALCGFICSSNNNITRISSMVGNLCTHFGPLLGHHAGQTYHDFPAPTALTGPDVERRLRELGFGYRAKYIHQTAKLVTGRGSSGDDNGLHWLNGLRNPERPILGQPTSPAGPMLEGGREGYRRAHEALLGLQGVGPKVADCVCLMGLGWGEAVPIDTHVWQIAQRDYKFAKSKQTSLTKATYDAVANRFRELWGVEAGWAHSVLFTADLKAFSDRLTTTTTTTTKKNSTVGKLAVKKEDEADVEVKVKLKTEEKTDLSVFGVEEDGGAPANIKTEERKDDESISETSRKRGRASTQTKPISITSKNKTTKTTKTIVTTTASVIARRSKRLKSD